jgi:hypothetical protein
VNLGAPVSPTRQGPRARSSARGGRCTAARAFGTSTATVAWDAVVTALEAAPELWRKRERRWKPLLRVLAKAGARNRDAVGTRISVTTATMTQHNESAGPWVRRRLGAAGATSGSARNALVKQLKVVWPGGAVQTARERRRRPVLTLEQPEAAARAAAPAR